MTPEINKHLHEALLAVHAAYTGNRMDETTIRSINYADKCYGWINDALDEVEVNYFNNTPDGDRQNELFDERIKNGGKLMSDKEAYEILMDRFNNTEFSYDNELSEEDKLDGLKENIRFEMVHIYNRLGCDRFENHDKVIDFIAEDILACTTIEEFNSDDVLIAFRRFIERDRD